MRATEAGTRILLAAFIATICTSAMGEFRIAGPTGSRNIFSELAPTDQPPFCHWDLRTWNACTVSFRVTSQSPGLLAGDDTVDPDGNVLSGPNGICETAAAPGDVQVIPVGNGEPNHIAVGPGNDGFPDTLPFGDDQSVGDDVDTGANGVCESTAEGDDTQTIPRGQGAPNKICVTGGNSVPNSGVEQAALTRGVLVWNDVTPALHQWSAAGTSANGEAVDGVNVLDFGDPAQRPELAGLFALTYISCDTTSGVITDADVLFNDTIPWSLGKSGGICQGGTLPGNPCRADAECGAGGLCGDRHEDLVGTAIHEAGHMLGLHHSTSATATMYKTAPLNLDLRSLENDDRDGKNFLYTPDLGDAPDPSFPSFVHGNPTPPDDGAEHLFGWRRQFASYLYEWLGASVDDNQGECEALVVDQDAFDDGVEFAPRVALRGFPLRIRVTVSSSAPASRYAGKPMFLNGWLDLNGNGIWEATEHLVQDSFTAADRRVYQVLIPDTAPDEFWTRFRLDWDEDASQPAADGLLDGVEGAAQFGEVEDHKVPVKDPELAPGEPSRPHHPLHFPHDVYIDPATGELIVNYSPGCDAVDHTIYWGSLEPGTDFSSYTGQACFLGADGVASFDPGPGSVFWLIVANDGEREGSYGTDSEGFERPPADDGVLDECAYPQVIGAVCDYGSPGAD